MRHATWRPLLLALVVGATACAMPVSAPRINSSKIEDRNEIARIWRAFAIGAREGDTEETWGRMTALFRERDFANDPAAFSRFLWDERDGVLAEIETTWLFRLDSGIGWAAAQPAPSTRIREIRFQKEDGAWRVDGWTLVPGP